MLAFIGTLGAPELIIILVIIMVLFGAKKIPGLMKGIGNGIREFKKASEDGEIDDSKKDSKSEISS